MEAGNFTVLLVESEQNRLLTVMKQGDGSTVTCNSCEDLQCGTCAYGGMTVRDALIVSFMPIARSQVTQLCPPRLRDDALGQVYYHLVKIIDNLPEDLERFHAYLWSSLRGHLYNFMNAEGVIKRGRNRKDHAAIYSLEAVLASRDTSMSLMSRDSTELIDNMDLVDTVISNGRDRAIFAMMSHKYKMKEIGEHFGVSDSYISRRCNTILDQLHTAIESLS